MRLACAVFFLGLWALCSALLYVRWEATRQERLAESTAGEKRAGVTVDAGDGGDDAARGEGDAGAMEVGRRASRRDEIRLAVSTSPTFAR